LAVEEHFYLIWPFILVLLRKHLRAAATVTLCAAIAVFVWRTIDSTHGWLIPFGTDINAKTDTRLDALLWGCLAAFAYPYLQSLATDSRLFRHAWKVIVPVAMLLTIFQNAPGGSFFRAVIFPAMIVSTALSPVSALSRLLSHSVMSWVGRLSYSIYIWQQLALFPTLASDSPLRTVQQFPLDLIAIVVMATFSYYLVERPMIRLGHRITQEQERGFGAQPNPPSVVAAATSFAR
jgi:peptidoglycan/LPS O-acetylase OafA/YrhL